MSNHHGFVAGGLSALIIAGIAGCEQSGKKLEPPIIVARPLAFDPTEHVDVDGWWSNETHLLHLEIAGRFVLYPDRNRYSDPVDIGRWHRISYAVVHLEPYDSRPREQLRVAVDRRGGRIVLDVPGFTLFSQITGPPLVAEDELLGPWVSPTGRLVLAEDGRYRHQAVVVTQDPVSIAGHDGRWRLSGDQLTLDPDPPGLGPYFFIVEQEDKSRRLRGSTTYFTPEPPAEFP